MKNLCISIVCLLMAGTLHVIAQNDAQAKIILHHEGNATFFDRTNFNSVLDAAVDGDTIYLSAGSFLYSTTSKQIDNSTYDCLSITKKIAVIGAGAEYTTLKPTSDYRYIDVAIGRGSESLTITMFEGINLENTYLTVSKAIEGLKIKKCKLNFRPMAAVINAQIDRCNGYIDWNGYAQNPIVYNSELAHAYNYSGSKGITYINCNIENLDNGGRYGYNVSCYNCIIRNPSGDPSNTYYNCLSYYGYGDAEKQNCWSISNNPLTMTVEDLTDENYLGTDGTVVGMYGGKTPYTLDTNLPRVSEYSADVDPQTKKITVNLKVSNQ